MPELAQLEKLGQSVWLDFIRRSLITSGEMATLVAQGVQGMTSNPAIFEKAIAGSADYDDEIQSLVKAGMSVDAIYETLAIKDIQMAADVLAPVYRSTGGRDGYVSLEVSPFLARDTERTTAEARRLFEAVGRPNLMIKIPATPEGLPAIAASLAAGVNVNVTLIFGLDNYRAVAEAYVAGLERLAVKGPSAKGGHPVNRIASVASFFVSRVDTAVDKELEKKGAKALLGKIAIANCKLAYADYRSMIGRPRWRELAAKGARPQRVLWASTSTKNPAYPDTLYVDELIGPDTVNTLPPETLKAFVDHGRPSETLTRDLEGAQAQVRRLAELGIDLEAVTRRLQEEGVEAFAKPFQALLDSIDAKRRRLT
ncbi:MAG: transaldolase [Desulfobacterales bacterium]|jgi:transaldolase|nr:transaldolase [Desulfobacterales bacterium]